MNRRSVFFTFVFSVVVVILTAEFFNSSKAAFTTPLTINFTYPLAIHPSFPTIKIAGSGIQQVYRLGSVAPSGIFSGLDPKAGTSPAGTMLTFTYQNAASVGANDFVYAIRIKNEATSNGQLQTALIGTCRTITSIGYARDPSLPPTFANPTVLSLSIGNNIGAGFDVSPGQETAIIFYTTPDPPVLADTTITGGLGLLTIPSAIFQQIYGACPADLMTDIKAGCTAASVSDNPVTAIAGSTVFYEVVIKNNGLLTLNNLIITDTSTSANLNSQFMIGSSAFTGILFPGQSAMAVFSETVNSSGSKNINVLGEYLIPKQDGTPSGQTFPLPGSNSILSDGVIFTVVAPPSLTSSFTITPTNFTTLPQTLTYTLKATNTGSAPLSTVFDLDAKLKALLAAPPAGLVVSPSVSFPTAAQTIAAGSMLTQSFTITANTLAAWQALADVSDVGKSTSSLTVNASIAGLNAPVCGTASLTQTVQASTNFMPPCTLDIVKTIACDLGAGLPPDSNFSATAIVLKGAPVYYRYKVTNSSLLDIINNISITDPLLNLPLTIGTLAPGEMKIVNISAIVPSALPSNLTVTVNGVCAKGNVTNTATSGLRIVDPSISASKTVNGSVDLTNYTPGTPLVWSLTATNKAISGVPLDLKIDDPFLQGISGVVFKLGNTPVTLPYIANNVAPGSSVTITASITFNTAAEFKAVADADQVLRNVVNVTASDINYICGAFGDALRAKAESTIRLFVPPTSEVCIIRTCEPNCPPISAGSEAAMKAPFSDDKPGSLLLYNLYTSSSSGDAAQNTRLSLTNTGPSTTFAHLFFIDGTSCNVSDTFACLSPNQTTSFLASEIDPGVTGYVVALAVNEEGCPVSFNYLIGSSFVKFASGQAAHLNAQAVAALYSGVLNNCTASSSETVLRLDGIDYGQSPSTLIANTIFSQADKQSTMLVVNPVGGNFNTADSVNTIGTLSGQVFDETEKGFSFVASINRCQLQTTMNDNFPRIPTRLSKVIRSGTVGMMRFATNDKAPIAGAIITFNPDVKANASGFSQGHNLHFSSLTNKATYTIPIFRPHL